MRALVILPTYDEAENVLPLSREILALAADIDVLVVDDASPDGTADLVAEAGREEPRLLLLRRPGKLGLGGAYLAGFRFGLERDYELLLTMDCDGSHRPAHLPAMLAAARESDVVIGSRYVPGGGIARWAWYRRALSAFGNLYARTLLRLPVRDCTSGYRCYRREALERVDPFAVRASGYSFLEELVWRVHRCGLAITEVPILFEERVHGVSKIDSSEIWRAAWHVIATAVAPPPVARLRRPGAGGAPLTDPTESPRRYSP